MSLARTFAGSTVGSTLTTRATSDPEGAYLRFRDDTWTFGQVDAEAEALAAGLASLGLSAGEPLALVLPPCPEFVVSMFAAAKLGAVIVPLNPKSTGAELQYALRHSGAACAVTIEQADSRDYIALFEELMPHLPDLRHVVTVGMEELWHDDRIFQFEDLLSSGSGRDFPASDLRADADCFALVYTSGTMGKPKGVELSHSNLVAAAAGMADTTGLRPEDRIIGVSALFHVFGLGPGLLSSLLSGASLILQENADPRATLELIERWAATVHYGIPTQFLAELAELSKRPPPRGALSSLRLAVVAGAPVGDELVSRLERELGVVVTTAYSLTEGASVVCASRPGDSFEKRRFTSGRPLPSTEVKILETDGSELPVESVGEIAVRGPGMMLGYHRQPRETSAVCDADGFYRTGDLGLVDEDGYLHLVGRRKDVIIRSGFTVYPREVEARIESHPAVQEVAVVGVSDPLLGESICACVIPVEGAIVTDREIMAWCRDALADDKIPDAVRFIDALPRTDTGQVRRTELSRWSTGERSSG